MLTFEDLLAEHRHALDDTTALAASAGDLTVPTPCAGWDLADLFGHMVGQNLGFTAAVADGDAPVAAYSSVPVTVDDVAQRWQESAGRVRDAFGAADPGATMHLAEFGFRPTVTVALGMQLLDAAVHAWDVATALGRDYRPSEATIGFVLDMARQIAARPGGTPVFAAPLVERGEDPWGDALRLLGRDPGQQVEA
ncbi:TIGR03086 family protein [Nocardioides sp. YR527]|uniref:TIGR03086 family metal-binding protein n=1 Tax=Nocardioides sp. YR527 TaxID=1881028 RepID=UPI000891330D|nr:TIGR03086 family metal-binding protein [Nocardioides sp. YR527]SDJ79795.1 TIGR03086 family protein [Nocardioides sp. YR527]